MNLGEKILELRKKKCLSQEQLGEKIEVTRQTISNWELNETAPNPKQLKLLSKELNVSIDELLDNDINQVIVEKVSNTEKLAGLILKLIKIIFISFIVFILLMIVLFFLFRVGDITKNKNMKMREESIICNIFNEEYSYSVRYEEETGIIHEAGGDAYLSDILDLDQYEDAHKAFNKIIEYVNKNGGTYEIITSEELK